MDNILLFIDKKKDALNDEIGFKDYLLDKIENTDTLYLPYDLAKIFFELNAKLRTQMNTVIKSEEISSTNIQGLKTKGYFIINEEHRKSILDRRTLGKP